MLPDTYRKLVATRRSTDFGAVAAVVEAELTAPGPGELVVRNRYAGVNASDVNVAAGRYTPGPSFPADLGFEVVGEVAAVGEGVKRFAVGDAVATLAIGAGYREYQVVRAAAALPVPEASAEVVALLVSGLTASIGLEAVGEMGEGETVLVTAAAGGTGQYAVQLARRAGNHVVGTCGTPEKAEMLRALGCDRPIQYREEDVAAVLAEEYPDGVDLVYECVGGELFDACLEALAVRGRLVCIGYVSEYVGGPERVSRRRIYTDLVGRSASVRGFFLPHYADAFRAHLVHLVRYWREGDLRVTVDERRFEGLEAVPDAVAHLHAGRSRGKVVVRL